ncbi:6-phosphogluconolactonase [Frigidibacter albus]|uniref:6-phosphogluconolactonase n=1 Tax=Frigidibacter albus TaxID=1465486 RepID=A0A6L8VJ91_9RHOB|nr:6-phosphogluconolactonase [Frigidibacter albus]MZQ89861.1 6-phosphogluconolactonase [Frigidibacter albus]NBE31764.1 6-phosphogluconolactonase [Frigidibacter albus]GGH56273.1 6-phosphogluconolactonase [Frigidibacter albus]
MKFVEYPDREAMFMGLADRLSSELGETLRMEDGATLCVPGGTTPGPVFDLMSASRLDWERVTVLLNDERWVPESSERSNAGLLRRRLLVERAAAARYLPLYAPTETPEEAIPDLAAAIEPHLPISVLLLGMGADRHIASLFPGADRLAEALAADAPILLPMRADAACEPRVTLSARVLAGAMRIHILITGDEKRAALDSARALPPEEAPVRAVLANATVHWAA